MEELVRDDEDEMSESDDNEQMIKDANELNSGEEINSEDCGEHGTLSKYKKPRKTGIIYLSTIPPFMNVTKIREILGQYGKIGRVFLQPKVLKNAKGKWTF